MRPLARVCIVAFACGCEVPAPPMPLPATIEVSEELSAEHLEQVQEAVDSWNERVPGVLVKTRVVSEASKSEGTGYVHYVDTTADLADTVVHACWAEVRLHKTYANAAELRVVLEHELGHVIGLEHVDDEASVMQKAPPWTAQITEGNASEAARLLEQHRDQHKTCKRYKRWVDERS